MRIKSVMALGALAAAEDLEARFDPFTVSNETSIAVRALIDRVRWFARELDPS